MFIPWSNAGQMVYRLECEISSEALLVKWLLSPLPHTSSFRAIVNNLDDCYLDAKMLRCFAPDIQVTAN